MKPALEEQEAQRLVETYSDLILRLSYTYLNHTQDAQDICQTVFLKLWEKAPAFVSPDHERAWIIRTTANTCKDLLKSHWRKTTAPLEAAAAAVCAMGVAGELAWARMSPQDGNATYRDRIIDAVCRMDGAALEKGANYEMR